MDLCFLCTKDIHCAPVDDRVVSQVEYLLPEIKIIKWGIPLRICAVCEGDLFAFSKFKHCCVESSRRLESSIRNSGALGTVHVVDNNAMFNIKSETTEDVDDNRDSATPLRGAPKTQLDTCESPANVRLYTDIAFQNPAEKTKRVSALPQSQLHKSEVTPNIALYIDKNSDNAENIFIKEEQLEETPHEIKFCNKIIQNMWKEKYAESNSIYNDTDNQAENSTENKNVTTGKREEMWQKSSIESEEKIVIEIDTNYITHRTEIDYNLKTKIDKKAEHRCNFCNKLFISKASLSCHTKKKHWRIKNLQCILCEKKFNHEYDFNKHIVLHNGIKNFQCSICKKRFSNKPNFKEHIKFHNTRKDFHYATHGDSSTLETYLKNHMEKPGRVRAKNAFSCTVGKKFFREKFELARHVKSHSEIIDLQCDVCSKSFPRKCDLVRHRKIHSEIKDFLCDLCNKSFRWKSHLDRHLKIHSEIKEFQCDICSKSFRRKSQLSAHMNTHSAIKDFQCDICNKSFRLKSHLINHMNIHSEIKEFQCDKCSKSFRLKRNLVKHMIIHSGIKYVQCDVCSKPFRWRSHLVRHMKIHSGV